MKRRSNGTEWLLVVGALLTMVAGCGGSMTQGAHEPQEAPGIHWEPAQLRADGGDTAVLEVRVEGPSAVCDVAVSRTEGDAPPAWQSLALEGGRVTRGARVSESDVAPGPLRLRVQTCDGRELSTDVRYVSEAQRVAATIDI